MATLKSPFQILLLPLSFVYGIVVFIRNKLFDFELFKSKKFKHPILIGVGNLAVGGTGKTPHVESLMNVFLSEFNCAILSRGYKRNSSGFLVAKNEHTAKDIGDEPKQYHQKFSSAIVAVDEDRVNGVHQLIDLYPKLDLIVLDDSFQHRWINPNIKLLITSYSNRYTKDLLMPAGRLREWRYGSKRADYIVVSKCPRKMTQEEMKQIEKELNVEAHQKVFFSAIDYHAPLAFTKAAMELGVLDEKETTVLAITGIANPKPFLVELEQRFAHVEHLKFKDHHAFSPNDLEHIKQTFNNLNTKNKVIFSTEKDIMRLSLPTLKNKLNETPIFYLPIKVVFLRNSEATLKNELIEYVRKNKRN